MLKKIKIAAGFLTVIICILLGCERREKEPEALFLEEISKEDSKENEDGGIFSEQGETERVSPEIPEPETVPPQTPETSGAGAVTEPEETAQPRDCVVHICGAVNSPGVYTLKSGDRIYQAIEKADGFREDAEQNYLNQADLLSDGMKIYVPTQSEAANLTPEEGERAEWMISGGEIAAGSQREEEKDAEKSSLVNINTAGEEQLCTLPGVGSSKAKSIIAYREQNGPYRTIEEIMNVEGIKDGVFRKIKDSITV